jgi:hypothetical protein
LGRLHASAQVEVEWTSLIGVEGDRIAEANALEDGPKWLDRAARVRASDLKRALLRVGPHI